jgi:hypothetical protein
VQRLAKAEELGKIVVFPSFGNVILKRFLDFDWIIHGINSGNHIDGLFRKRQNHFAKAHPD